MIGIISLLFSDSNELYPKLIILIYMLLIFTALITYLIDILNSSKSSCHTRFLSLRTNYRSFKKSVRVTVFWITFARNKIETCGFRRSTTKIKRHVFPSKKFPGRKLEVGSAKDRWKNKLDFEKLALKSIIFVTHLESPSKTESTHIYFEAFRDTFSPLNPSALGYVNKLS